MTRLEIITQFLAQVANQPESEIVAWAHRNIDPNVLSKLDVEIFSEEIAALVVELDKDPEAFFRFLLGQVLDQGSYGRPCRNRYVYPVEAAPP